MIKNFLAGSCREYSIPLILGVVCALLMANLLPESYHHLVHTPIFGKEITLHWIVNDVFMVFFFAIAGVEIINSLSKGGALNPISKAVTPLAATAGGVIGPILVFFCLNTFFGESSYIPGWGICTPTDIALAWLIAKMIFGSGHPAVKFLLLLAVVDDAIGLVIIAVFYPDPAKEIQPQWLLMILLAMVLALLMNKLRIRYFEPYVLLCGTLSWVGMYNAGLHCALSLVFIIPFLPRTGKAIPHPDEHGLDSSIGRSALHTFERRMSPVVDYGLFFFGFTSAGVEFTSLSSLSILICCSLIFGKFFGILSFTFLATKLRSQLPEGMKFSDVALIGVISGIGFTVALFIAEQAFAAEALTIAAKMGALFSILIGGLALVIGRLMKIEKIQE